MAVAVILVPVMMVDALVMEMAEGASFVDRDVGIALHDIDRIVLVFCHFRIIRVVMVLLRDLLATATAAATMLMRMAFVVMVMPAGASVLVGVAFVVMPTAAAVLMGMAFVAMVMPTAAAMLMGVTFMVMVMPAGASVLVGVTFVVMVVPAGAFVIFFVFLVVCRLFAVMDGFLCLMAVTATAVMDMLFIVFFHGISPSLKWKRCFLAGFIL